MEKKVSVFSRDYIMAFATSVLLRLVVQFKITLIPIYMLYLGMSKVQAGFAMTVFTIFALISRPLNGYFIDKAGRKLTLFVGILLFLLSTVPFGFFKNLYILYLLQALSGFSFSIQTVALTTMVTDIVPEMKLTEGLGYFGLTASVTQALGPAIAVWSIDISGYPQLFLYAGISLVFALISLSFITYEKEGLSHLYKSDDTEHKTVKTNKLIDKLIERKALLPSAFIGCLSLTSSATTSFLVPYAQAEFISGIGLYYTARAVGLALSRIFAGKLEALFSKRTLISAGMLGIALGIGGLTYFRHVILLIILAFLYGMGFGLAHVLLNVSAVRNTPRNRRAFANATFYLAMDAGIGIGSVLWGAVGDFAGMGSIFLCAGIFTFGVLIWYTFSKHL